MWGKLEPHHVGLKTAAIHTVKVNVHLPGLQVLDAGQHVQVARRVLLDHIHDIVGPQALLEPPL